MKILHPDQTTRQPVVWRCHNPECHVDGKLFEFRSDYPVCPKCTASGYPLVQKRALIHLLVRDNMGEVLGQHGLRYRIACDLKRAELATRTNGEAATDNPDAANCPGCLRAAKNNKPTGQWISFAR